MAYDPAAQNRPHLRLVRGDASPEEIAAIVAVLAARARQATPDGGKTPGQREPVPAWADPGLAMRQYTHPAAGAWRLSGQTPGVRTRADW